MPPRLSILDFMRIDADATPGETLANTIRLAKLADDLGYERYWMSEHHSPEVATGCPETMSAIVLAATRRIRVGPAGILLKHYSPLKIADTFRTLEALFPGRVDLGLGRGGADPITTEALADGAPIAAATYDRKLVELVGHLRGGLPDGHPRRTAALTPRSRDIGSPLVWTLGSGEGSVPLAVHHRTAFSMARFFPRRSDADPVRAIRDYLSRSAAKGGPALANVAIAGVCGTTRERARELAAQHANPGIIPAVIGDPADAREAIEAVAREHGVEEVVFAPVGGHFADRCEMVELLAEEFQMSRAAPMRDVSKGTPTHANVITASNAKHAEARVNASARRRPPHG